MRFSIYILFMSAYNLMLFAIVKNYLYISYDMSKTIVMTLIALLAGNLLILYVVILRASGGTFYQDFNDVFKKHYNGKNYNEAYKKAMKDWSGGRFKKKK